MEVRLSRRPNAYNPESNLVFPHADNSSSSSELMDSFVIALVHRCPCSDPKVVVSALAAASNCRLRPAARASLLTKVTAGSRFCFPLRDLARPVA